jgi:tRNA (mo5U34)-methyltransferase
MPSAHIARQIRELGPWFHNLHLPDGTQTAPEHFLGDFPAYKWWEIRPFLRPDLSGIRALDIGCNAGYYSFELARRGAEVTAIDSDDRYLKQARWAARIMGLHHRIEFRRLSVYQLARESEMYDLVWFMGVFYHLRYPLLALDVVRRCCLGQMIFQTLTLPGDEVFATEADYDLQQREVMNQPGWPRMAFIEHRLAGDPTNWWAVNHAGVEALLRSAGFSVIRRIAHEIYSCQPGLPPSTLASQELDSVCPEF